MTNLGVTNDKAVKTILAELTETQKSELLDYAIAHDFIGMMKLLRSSLSLPLEMARDAARIMMVYFTE
jgi:hypothetical protein